MISPNWGSCLALALPLVGCAYSPREVADPPEITLNHALTDVADSLDELRKKTEHRPKVGLFVDEVTVQFNMSAKATSTGQIGITGANIPIPALGGLAGFSASHQIVNDGQRGNVIVVKLKNLATADMSKADKALRDRCMRNPRGPGCPVTYMYPQ